MFLNSGISSDYENLDIPGYRLVQSDHRSIINEVAFVFILNRLYIFMLRECINLDIKIDSKLCNLICSYRS